MNLSDEDARRLIRNIGYTMIYLDSIDNDVNGGMRCSMEMMRDCLFALQDLGYDVNLSNEDIKIQNDKILDIVKEMNQDGGIILSINGKDMAYDDFVKDVEAATDASKDGLDATDLRDVMESLIDRPADDRFKNIIEVATFIANRGDIN